MEDNYPYPKIGNLPFDVKVSQSDSTYLIGLQWLSSSKSKFDDSELAIAFKKSAEKVIASIRSTTRIGDRDILFFPIAFLYRHSFELKIKSIIKLGIELQLIKHKRKIKKVLIEHGLYKLWNIARQIIVTKWPSYPKEELSAVEAIIQEFNKIDKTGQKLRYTENKFGKKHTTNFPELVDLMNLQTVADGLHNFFEDCEYCLKETLIRLE